MFEAYLDGLERLHKFVPDVVIIDYPDLMELKGNDQRIAIGNNNKMLRGIAVKRNHAQLVLSQSNRESAKSKLVDTTHASEDWSKIATADQVFTYSQTPAEKKLGLGRLFAAKTRDEEGSFVTLMTQAYGMGQFCIDSCFLSSEYWDYLETGNRKRGRYDEDDED
jgi:hypothetical protein